MEGPRLLWERLGTSWSDLGAIQAFLGSVLDLHWRHFEVFGGSPWKGVPPNKPGGPLWLLLGVWSGVAFWSFLVVLPRRERQNQKQRVLGSRVSEVRFSCFFNDSTFET